GHPQERARGAPRRDRRPHAEPRRPPRLLLSPFAGGAPPPRHPPLRACAVRAQRPLSVRRGAGGVPARGPHLDRRRHMTKLGTPTHASDVTLEPLYLRRIEFFRYYSPFLATRACDGQNILVHLIGTYSIQ